jgi:hypothetical protein
VPSPALRAWLRGHYSSGVQGLKSFIVRAEASGSEVRGVTVLYD